MKESNRKLQGKEKEVSLLGIFGTDAMDLLSKKFSEATDFSFQIIDYRGQDITDGIICNNYCDLIKDSPECAECKVTAAFAAAKAAISCSPHIFTCPRGLCSIAVPIIVNEQYLGALVGGRVRCKEDMKGGELDRDQGGNLGRNQSGNIYGDLSRPDEVKKVSAKEDLSQEVLKAYQQIPVFSKEKIQAIGDILFFMLREMAEKEAYNQQLLQVSSTESQVRELIEENESLKKDLRQSELLHLREHLHPQFLLDMFATTANFAVLEDAYQTEEIIVDFASIIRYYLDESREAITISQEMDQITRLLTIIRSKYEGKFNYHIQVSDQVKDIVIPVLVLFPLIGYTLNYGVSTSVFNGTLYMDVVLEDKEVLVTIQMEDQGSSTGSGHPLPKIFLDDKLICNQIHNYTKRLGYIYGESFSLNLKQDIITLRFPATYR